MARPSRYATSLVEHHRSTDLAWLQRWGMLAPDSLAKTKRVPAITWSTPQGQDKLGVIAKSDGVLLVKRDDGGQLSQLFVPFTYTPTKFGGCRKWFRCPGCGRGARVLYGWTSLRCRKCRGLKYRSQYEMPAFRLLARARKIRIGLGGSGALDVPLPPKPRYMRWKRYRRLERLVLQYEASGSAALSQLVHLLTRRLRR
jgi:hypothetical protein